MHRVSVGRRKGYAVWWKHRKTVAETAGKGPVLPESAANVSIPSPYLSIHFSCCVVVVVEIMLMMMMRVTVMVMMAFVAAAMLVVIEESKTEGATLQCLFDDEDDTSGG